MGRRAGPPATGRGASAPWSPGRRPGGPNRAAPRPSTGAPRARGRRRTSFSTDRPRRPAAPAEESRPGRPASAAPTRPPAGSRGRSRGCARAWRCARCSGASFVDLHPWYPPFLGIPRQHIPRILVTPCSSLVPSVDCHGLAAVERLQTHHVAEERNGASEVVRRHAHPDQSSGSHAFSFPSRTPRAYARAVVLTPADQRRSPGFSDCLFAQELFPTDAAVPVLGHVSAPHPRLAQVVQAQAGHHGGEVGLRRANIRSPLPAQVGFLHDALGVRDAAEYPVGYREEERAVSVESGEHGLGRRIALCHRRLLPVVRRGPAGLPTGRAVPSDTRRDNARAAHSPTRHPAPCNGNRSAAETPNAVLHVPGGCVKTLSGPGITKLERRPKANDPAIDAASSHAPAKRYRVHSRLAATTGAA